MSIIWPDKPAIDYLPDLCAADGCLADPAPGGRYCRRHLRSRQIQAQQHQQRQDDAVQARIRRVSRDLGVKLYAIEIVGTPVVKFGMSRNPTSRMMDLQVSHPVPLHLLGHVGCDRRLEKDVHLYCAQHHVRGEWFRQEGRATEVIGLIKSGDPISIYKLIGRDPPSTIF